MGGGQIQMKSFFLILFFFLVSWVAKGEQYWQVQYNDKGIFVSPHYAGKIGKRIYESQDHTDAYKWACAKACRSQKTPGCFDHIFVIPNHGENDCTTFKGNCGSSGWENKTVKFCKGTVN